MSTMSMIGQLASGMLATCEIFVLTLVFSLPLGLLVAFGRMSKIKPVQLITKIYISIMRGTPLMLQLLVVYFGPYYLFGMRLSTSYRFTATIIGFAVNYAAYFAEIFRGGISSIPVGQREAAQTLGLSRAQTFFSVLLPQTAKRVLLPVTNEVITLVKDTALASTIAVADLMSQAERQVSNSSSIEPYIVAMLIYLVINGVVEQLCKLAERKFNYYQ